MSKINLNELISKPDIMKNDDFVKYVSKTKNIQPMPDYYSEEVKKYFDIYGISYTEIIGDLTFIISVYFYKLKNNELLTTELEPGCGIGMLLCIMDNQDPDTYPANEDHEWYVSSKTILENIGYPTLVKTFDVKYPNKKKKTS